MPKSKRNIHAVAEETLTPPDVLSHGQIIARVKNAAGNNLYNLHLPSGDALLAELPARFRGTIFIRRGSYVLVDTASLADRGNKLGGEIVNIVRDEKAWRKAAFWPDEFAAAKNSYQETSDDEDEDEGPKFPPSEDESDQL